MIAIITGKVLDLSPLQVVISAGGVGYEVHIPLTTSARISPLGSEVTLHTHAVYRDDSQSLYGFAEREDRDFFRLLVDKVSGIGPKIGISILSKMTVTTLRSAIARNDVALLSKCPGIGKKTAQRLVVELRDSIFPKGTSVGLEAIAPAPVGVSAGSALQDAVAALVELGLRPTEAEKRVGRIWNELGASASSEDLIKGALR